MITPPRLADPPPRLSQSNHLRLINITTRITPKHPCLINSTTCSPWPNHTWKLYRQEANFLYPPPPDPLLLHYPLTEPPAVQPSTSTINGKKILQIRNTGHPSTGTAGGWWIHADQDMRPSRQTPTLSLNLPVPRRSSRSAPHSNSDLDPPPLPILSF